MSQLANQTGAYPGFCSMKRVAIFLLPLDGVLFNRSATPSVKFAGFHFYSWVKVKCLVQEHSTMFSARARTQTAKSGEECTNHEAITSSGGRGGIQLRLT